MFDPYLATLGGGERYALALAEHLHRQGWQVHVASPHPVADATLARLGMPCGLRQRRLPTWAFTPVSTGYDLAVLVTNHLPAPSLAKRSVLVVQFPMPAVRHRLRARLATVVLARYRVVVYSPFVAGWVRARWSRPSSVITPPVQLGAGYDESEKQRLIVAVGRFFVGQHAKRHDLLIDAFSCLGAAAPGWRLVLVGGSTDDESARKYLADLRARASGLNIEFVVSADQELLASTYRQAALFWHAAGFGRHDDEPERAEHFGMAAVEAMSWGAVPLVYDDGGIADIVTDDVGLRWHDVGELVAATASLIAEPARRYALAGTAAAQARARYSPDTFGRAFDQLLALPGGWWRPGRGTP